MITFARNPNKRRGANVALAIALMCGTAIGVTALEAPAHAQKKDKKDKASKSDFSKEFSAVFNPMVPLAQGDAAQKAQAATQADALYALMNSPQEKYQGGIMLYNLGGAVGDEKLRLRGMASMIDSGLAPVESLGNYNFTAYQLAANTGDYATARKFLGNLVDNDYPVAVNMADGTSRDFRADDFRLMVAESYFDEKQHALGYEHIRKLIAERAATNGTVPERWITRGMSEAYENGNGEEAAQFGTLFVTYYPSDTSWGDAIAIQRNVLDYDNQASLDLLRLAFRANAMREARNYVDYIEFADARRLPGEVKTVVDAGISAGMLETGDVFVNEARTVANGRIAADKADLPSLERDARAANSTALTASAAGDAFLSYGNAVKAEEMYKIALGKSGVDTPRVLTRLGIAQADQGKSAEAVETFAQVQGARKAIADLWAVYAKQKAAPVTGG